MYACVRVCARAPVCGWIRERQKTQEKEHEWEWTDHNILPMLLYVEMFDRKGTYPEKGWSLGSHLIVWHYHESTLQQRQFPVTRDITGPYYASFVDLHFLFSTFIKLNYICSPLTLHATFSTHISIDLNNKSRYKIQLNFF